MTPNAPPSAIKSPQRFFPTENKSCNVTFMRYGYVMTNAERQKKYREKRNAERNELVKIVTEKVENVTPVTQECPEGVDSREWRYACERAERAKRYALAMPGFVKPSEVKYQDPVWQWENEVRGRFGGIIGGSLSGTRSEQKGN